ncbi:GNAT family N-acetyltransferase [Virgibacillus sp. MSP4-1]|uniref:GNAT family N-acetyltransferase n=1 Tax=Virgibacillus sp. MSP4-1 TaxID=2700081 RepID=UPI0003A1C3BC|nr:GNAT family N-acetyltransferase [Virgibacillus sp. MSP4-1]QHS24207.1 GNAT family N-acetyltransferase [Virgibacillus sp. MSP4-1]
MQFEKIDLQEHSEKMINFRKDSFKVSFGDASNFDKEAYLRWVEEKQRDFPEGFVLVEEDGRYIGQIELSIREYDGRTIGYVHLFYLVSEMRGKGKGEYLHNYARQFFHNHNLHEYHLRVSPSNTSAIRFYHKNGMVEAGSEIDGKVIRMKGYL